MWAATGNPTHTALAGGTVISREQYNSETTLARTGERSEFGAVPLPTAFEIRAFV